MAQATLARWRRFVAGRRTVAAKASLFHSLNLRVAALQQWKEFTRRSRAHRELQQKEKLFEQAGRLLLPSATN